MAASDKKYGFIPASDLEGSDRIILSISGMDKQGKTHFALTAPGPLALFSTDIGEEGVVEKFGDKDIQLLRLEHVDEDDPTTEAEGEFDRFKEAYYYALKGKRFRTLVIDTATEIWELLRLARFGRLTQVMPYQYGPVNKEYRELIRDAYKQDKNIVLIHKMKPKYVNDKRTGEYERSGFGDTGFLVQVNAEIYRDEDGDFVLWVQNCRKNPDLAGEELVGPMCSFDFLSSMANGG